MTPAPDEDRRAPADRGRWPRWLTRSLQLVATVVVTAFLVRTIGIDPEALREAGVRAWKPTPGLFLAASVLMLAGYLLSAVLWSLMVVELGGRRLRFRDAARIYLTANLARYVPGKVWQIAGLAILARRGGVSGTIASAGAVLGQVVSLGGASLVACGLLLAERSALAPWERTALFGLLGVVFLLTTPTVLKLLLRVAFRLTGEGNAPKALQRLHPSFGLRWILLYGVNWAVYAAGFWLLALSFDLGGTFFQIGPSFTAAYVLGYAAFFAPAGAGVRESALAGLLKPYLGQAAWGLALVSRIWMTVLEVLPALFLVRGHFKEPESPEVGDQA